MNTRIASLASHLKKKPATSPRVTTPTVLQMELFVNDVLRQSANTRDLIVDIPGMIEMSSSVMTLRAGDIIASGTPAGVGPLREADRVTIKIDQVGSMALNVIQDRSSAHGVWRK